MNIRENRLFPIENKVFSLQNIKELAEVVLQEYLISVNSNIDAFIKFNVKCYDHSSFESSSILIFESSSIINKKRIKSIIIEYREVDTKYIKIRLNHGYVKEDKEYINDSDVEIGGNNSFWVSGINDKINTLLNSFPEQSSTLLKYQSKINWFSFIIGTYFGGIVLDFFKRNEKNFVPTWYQATHNDIGTFFGLLLIGVFFGGFWVVIIVNSVLEDSHNLWPSVELQIGPDHLLVEKNRRKYFRKLLIIIIIPLVLSIVSTLITNVF